MCISTFPRCQHQDPVISSDYYTHNNNTKLVQCHVMRAEELSWSTVGHFRNPILLLYTFFCSIWCRYRDFIFDTIKAFLCYLSNIHNIQKMHTRKCSQEYMYSNPYSRCCQRLKCFFCSVTFWACTSCFTSKIVQKSYIQLFTILCNNGGSCCDHWHKKDEIAE